MKHLHIPQGWRITDRMDEAPHSDGYTDPNDRTIHISPHDSWPKDIVLIHEIAHAKVFDRGIGSFLESDKIKHETIAFHRQLSHVYKEHDNKTLRTIINSFSTNKNLYSEFYRTHSIALTNIMNSNLWKRCLDKLEKQNVS